MLLLLGPTAFGSVRRLLSYLELLLWMVLAVQITWKKMTNHNHPNRSREAALRRLIDIAKSDNNEASLVADFLLAWWNAGKCGGFDFTHFWKMQDSTLQDIFGVMILIATAHEHADILDPGLDADFHEVAWLWRAARGELKKNDHKT